MTIPTLPQAQTLLADAETRNPGPWVAHSVNVARAAQFIAERHPDLDADRAYILGLLHDIGRREGVTGMRHVIDGYTFLRDLGYAHAARIALTHSFPYQHPHSVFGAWDCTEAEFAMLSAALMDITYDDYDRLLQLCDALALPAGFCLIEKRLIDVFMRYAQEGVGPEVHTKFQQVFAIQRHFEEIIGCSIYEVLPGVVETTFGEAVMATTALKDAVSCHGKSPPNASGCGKIYENCYRTASRFVSLISRNSCIIRGGQSK